MLQNKIIPFPHIAPINIIKFDSDENMNHLSFCFNFNIDIYDFKNDYTPL